MFKEGAFPSKLHNSSIATRVGIPLAICIGVCFITGLMSHYQQQPVSWLPIPAFPAWGYRLTQGLHVATGIAAIPLLLIKLWVVTPRLYEWPPVRSILHGIERLAIFVLVSTMIFQLVTGLMNITQWYPWKFPFIQTHFAIAFVLVGALLLHLAAKGPEIMAAIRDKKAVESNSTGEPLAPASADTADEANGSEHADGGEVGSSEHADGLSRRGFFVVAGLAAGAVTVTTVGQSFSPLEKLALLAPRVPSTGPQGLPVNRTALAAAITPALVGPAYRLVVAGTREVSLSADQLHARDQTEVVLPIACVEGWSASGRWTGIRLSELLDEAGIDPEATIKVISLENGAYGTTSLPSQFARHSSTLLALQLGGQTLSLDHGYPARIIAPNRPGVLQTKWVTRLEIA